MASRSKPPERGRSSDCKRPSAGRSYRVIQNPANPGTISDEQARDAARWVKQNRNPEPGRQAGVTAKHPADPPQLSGGTMLKMDRIAEIALKALSPGDRNLVNRAITRLRIQTTAGRPYRSFGRTRVEALRGGLYLTIVHQRLGILFREIDGDLVVHDIFPSGRLNAMYGSDTLARAG